LSRAIEAGAMPTMNVHLHNGDVTFRCSGCGSDFLIDAAQPFVPQLRAVSYDHHCPVQPRRPSIDLTDGAGLRGPHLHLVE
jgi:hypothetical protein